MFGRFGVVLVSWGAYHDNLAKRIFSETFRVDLEV